MLLLGIDIGTSGTKSLLMTDKGDVLATATVEHSLQSPKPGWSEQDPDEWWDATCKSVGACLKMAKQKGTDVAAIGLSGQMHGSVFLDKRGKVLRPALLWNDQRTQKQCDEITDKAGGVGELVRMVGNPALTGFTAPKLLWLRDHEPRKYEKLATLLLPKDYVRFKMTGERATDVADASGTLLLDVVNRRWSGQLVGKLGIDNAILPRLYESQEVTGVLTKDAAELLGLKAGTPVVGGAGDQAAGAVGNGVVTGGVVNAALGTSGVIFAHSDEPVSDPQARVHTMCHAVPGKWCVFGCMLSAAGSLQWYADELAVAEKAQAKKDKASVFDLLIALAEKAKLGSEGLVFLPYLTGERCPHPDPKARGGWVGLTRRHGRGEMIRSLIEGVTFGMNDMLKIIAGDMKIPVSQARATGGGAKSPFWLQMQADVYDTPVALTNSEEGGAFGVALLAGVGVGAFKSVEQACKATIKVTKTVKPDKKAAAKYANVQAVYDKLYGDLKDRFHELDSLAAE